MVFFGPMTEIFMDDFNDIIQQEVKQHFPELLKDLGSDAWKWIQAQIWQESEFHPHAVSPCGAQGLMQLMPSLSKDMGIRDPFDPKANIQGGVIYIAEQYRHFPEIPLPLERLKFAFGAYNGGRGYINKALILAKLATVDWQKWLCTCPFLADSRCNVNGKRPDSKQIIGYISSIVKKRAQV